MSSASPMVSVIILSYNRPEYLRQALASVRAQSYENLELIVVDNPSPRSGEITEIVGAHTGARLVRNAANLGYAGGMNRGIERARGHYVYLTEDDIELDADCIRHLVEHMDEHSSGGLISPIMYNQTAGTIRCAGGEMALGGVYQRRTHGEGQSDRGQFAQPFGVTYVDGATMFARAELFRRLGGFREEYFMYVEAVELCARVLKAGGKIEVVPRAKVYHFEPAEGANTSPQFDFHRFKNLFSLYLLHAPARVLPEFFLRYALLTPLRSLAGSRAASTPAMLKALLWIARRAPALLRERRSGGLPSALGFK